MLGSDFFSAFVLFSDCICVYDVYVLLPFGVIKDILGFPASKLIQRSCMLSAWIKIVTKHCVTCVCVRCSTATMPLAKVIPIVNGLIYTILADAPNPFVQVIFRDAGRHCQLSSNSVIISSIEDST